jgi:hypothetical protein
MEQMRDGEDLWEMRITRCNARLTPRLLRCAVIGTIRRECLDFMIPLNEYRLELMGAREAEI